MPPPLPQTFCAQTKQNARQERAPLTPAMASIQRKVSAPAEPTGGYATPMASRARTVFFPGKSK